MRIAGVEIRRLTAEERERIPESAWVGGVAAVVSVAVVSVVLDLGWFGTFLALAVGLVGAFTLLWVTQR